MFKSVSTHSSEQGQWLPFCDMRTTCRNELWGRRGVSTGWARDSSIARVAVLVPVIWDASTRSQWKSASLPFQPTLVPFEQLGQKRHLPKLQEFKQEQEPAWSLNFQSSSRGHQFITTFNINIPLKNWSKDLILSHLWLLKSHVSLKKLF